MLAAKGETRPMDITFSCPLCGQHMVIDEAGAGMVVPCPKCEQDVQVPGAVDSAPETEKERTVALKWTPPPEHKPGDPRK